MYVNLGFICKKVWGNGVKITTTKFITGALFISVCVSSVNKVVSLNDGILIISSLFMGYGADNLMIKFYKNKYWEKFDLVDKLDGDKKEKL